MKSRLNLQLNSGHVLVESLIVAGLWVLLVLSIADELLPAVKTSETTLAQQRHRIFSEPEDSELLQRSSAVGPMTSMKLW